MPVSVRGSYAMVGAPSAVAHNREMRLNGLPLLRYGAVTTPSSTGSDARERILEAAYDLFSREGIRAVGIDSIIERSGVARMTLYRHFRSKDDLVLAFLERREARWTRDWLQREAERRAT